MKTNNFNSNSNLNDSIYESFMKLEKLIEKYQIEGQGFISSELESRLTDLLECLENE